MTRDSDKSGELALPENDLKQVSKSLLPILPIGLKVAGVTSGVKMYAKKTLYVLEGLTIAYNAGLAAFSPSRLAPLTGLVAIAMLALTFVQGRARLPFRHF